MTTLQRGQTSSRVTSSSGTTPSPKRTYFYRVACITYTNHSMNRQRSKVSRRAASASSPYHTHATNLYALPDQQRRWSAMETISTLPTYRNSLPIPESLRVLPHMRYTILGANYRLLSCLLVSIVFDSLEKIAR